MHEIRSYIIKYGIMFIEKFENDNGAYIEMIVKFSSIRQMLTWVYVCLVADKKIIPIEKWDQDLKQSIWNDAKEFAAGRLTNEQCISFSKCLYVLKLL